jgi:hypothetical protein
MGHWNPLFFRFATSYVSSLRLIKLFAPALPNQSKLLLVPTCPAIESPTIVLRLWPLLMADDGQDTGDYGKRVPVEPQRAQGLGAPLSPLHLLLQPPYNVVFFNLTHWLFSHFGNLTSVYRTG